MMTFDIAKYYFIENVFQRFFIGNVFCETHLWVFSLLKNSQIIKRDRLKHFRVYSCLSAESRELKNKVNLNTVKRSGLEWMRIFILLWKVTCIDIFWSAHMAFRESQCVMLQQLSDGESQECMWEPIFRSLSLDLDQFVCAVRKHKNKIDTNFSV